MRMKTAEQATAGVDLKGQLAVVTGVNSGIGLETARVLALRGARVVGLARSLNAAEQTCAALPGDAIPLACELTDLESIANCAEALRAMANDGIHRLILNAGIMALPRLETVRGIEKQFATNHLGHFALTRALTPALGHTKPTRVIVVSSAAHLQAPRAGIEFDNLNGARGYSPWRAYGQSKLANILFANELARRLPGGSTANSLHPGVILTGLGRHMGGPLAFLMRTVAAPFMRTPAEGAATTCHVATADEGGRVSGRYFTNCQEARPSQISGDVALAKRLWEVSEQLTGDIGSIH
jgi:NAD(P)-dependent dehydrogenase (short-subunit alcohol dehydrogenase family)